MMTMTFFPKPLLSALFAAGVLFSAAAIPQIDLSPDKPDRIYQVGEPIRFDVRLTEDGKPLANTQFGYAFEGNAANWANKKLVTDADGRASVTTSLPHPGFTRILIYYKTPDGKEHQKRLGVAVDPQKITPGRPKPVDFDAYWDSVTANLKQLPMQAEITELPVDNSGYKDRVSLYSVKLNTLGDKPFVYGYLCVPKNAAAKSLPLLLSYQGAGFRDSAKLYFKASQGFLALDISAHGLPNGQSREFYQQEDKKNQDYRTRGSDNRDTIYFRGMIIRALRALQYMKTRPEWDGKNIIVTGGSQGGGQSLAVAGLDRDVTFCFAAVPALCDHGGELAGRTGGWPRILHARKKDPKVATACDYIDGAFFATRINPETECLLSLGFHDFVCDPASVYAAYNSIPAKKKSIIHDLNSDHQVPMTTWQKETEAIKRHLNR